MRITQVHLAISLTLFACISLLTLIGLSDYHLLHIKKKQKTSALATLVATSIIYGLVSLLIFLLMDRSVDKRRSEGNNRRRLYEGGSPLSPLDGSGVMMMDIRKSEDEEEEMLSKRY